MDDKEKSCDLHKNLQQMIRTTKQSDLERALQRMMQTTKSNDLRNAFEKMIKVTRSFDQEVEARQKEQEKNIADAFQKMIRLSRSLELENEEQLAREEERSRPKEKRIDKVKKKVPRRIRSFPAAFKRNPRAVIKYFLGMILGRVLAIVLYVLTTFIPSLPIPNAVANMNKPPEFFGKALSSMRSFFTNFNPKMIFATVMNIPADINKLIQKVGEFFTFYAKRTVSFILRAIQNPQNALQDMRDYFRKTNFNRLARTAVGVIFSFLLIKLAMIFLLPVFGGIALTVLGIKVSIILVVIVRMIVDKIGELLGKYVFNVVRQILKNQQIIKIICNCVRDKILGRS